MFAERIAGELQTYFRLSLLSFLFGGREATTGNMPAVRRLQKDWTGKSIMRKWYATNLGWSDGLIVHWNYMKVAFQLTVQTIPLCFFSFLFLLPSFIIFFPYLVSPLPVLSFQEAKMFRCWCPYKISKPLFLIRLKLLSPTFSLYLCQRNS